MSLTQNSILWYNLSMKDAKDNRIAKCRARIQKVEQLAVTLIRGGKPERLLNAVERMHLNDSFGAREISGFARAAMVHAKTARDAKYASYLMAEFFTGDLDLSGWMLKDLCDQEVGMCRRVGWLAGEANAMKRHNSYAQRGRFLARPSR